MDSYDSRYPYEYYEIGTPYAFYGSKNHGGTPATEEYIRKYSSILLEEDSNDESAITIKNSLQSQTISRYCRYVAVVVDKTYSSKSAFITVMFKNINNGQTEFLTRRYAVAIPSGCYYDENESMAVQSATSFSHSNGSLEKQGGITLDVANKSAGITLDANSNKPKGIGGITADTSDVKKNVSGITLDNTVTQRKTAGITLDIPSSKRNK